MLEELEIEVNVFDNEKLYNSVSKNIKCYFYNENVIDKYEITNSNNNLINQNTFDVIFTLNNAESIEYLRIYDLFENNLKKKFKYGVINDNVCTIKGITTPLKSSTFFIEFKIKNTDIVIKQELFKDKPLKYLNDEENFKASISFNNFIYINVIQKHLTDYKVLVKENDEIIKEFLLTQLIENLKIESLNKNRNAFITVEIYNKKNQIVYFKKELLVFDNNTKHNAELENFNNWNIFSKLNIRNINLINTENGLNYSLDIIDEFNNKKTYPIQKGNNPIPELKEGFYYFELFSTKLNYKKSIKKYYVEVYKDTKDYISYSKGYSKYNPINSIEVYNHSNINFKELNPTLIHITENFTNVIQPIYLEKSIKFDFIKETGLNKFIYKDSVHEEEFKSTIYINNNQNEIEIFDVSTDEKSLFYKNKENSIVLNDVENVYFKTKNCDYLMIKPFKLRNELKRIIFNDSRVTIFKEFIPCTLEFYKDEKMKKTLNILVEEENKLIVPLTHKKDDKFINIIPLKIQSLSYIRNKVQLTLRNRTKHFLYSYTIFNAKSFNKKSFLNLPIEEQEEFIKDVSSKVYEKNKTIDIELLKKEILKELEKMED